MPSALTRILCLFLLPCLIADTARAWSSPASSHRPVAALEMTSVFNSNAMVPLSFTSRRMKSDIPWRITQSVRKLLLQRGVYQPASKTIPLSVILMALLPVDSAPTFPYEYVLVAIVGLVVVGLVGRWVVQRNRSRMEATVNRSPVLTRETPLPQIQKTEPFTDPFVESRERLKRLHEEILHWQHQIVELHLAFVNSLTTPDRTSESPESYRVRAIAMAEMVESKALEVQKVMGELYGVDWAGDRSDVIQFLMPTEFSRAQQRAVAAELSLIGKLFERANVAPPEVLPRRYSLLVGAYFEKDVAMSAEERHIKIELGRGIVAQNPVLGRYIFLDPAQSKDELRRALYARFQMYGSETLRSEEAWRDQPLRDSRDQNYPLLALVMSELQQPQVQGRFRIEPWFTAFTESNLRGRFLSAYAFVLNRAESVRFWERVEDEGKSPRGLEWLYPQAGELLALGAHLAREAGEQSSPLDYAYDLMLDLWRDPSPEAYPVRVQRAFRARQATHLTGQRKDVQWRALSRISFANQALLRLPKLLRQYQGRRQAHDLIPIRRSAKEVHQYIEDLKSLILVHGWGLIPIGTQSMARGLLNSSYTGPEWKEDDLVADLNRLKNLWRAGSEPSSAAPFSLQVRPLTLDLILNLVIAQSSGLFALYRGRSLDPRAADDVLVELVNQFATVQPFSLSGVKLAGDQIENQEGHQLVLVPAHPERGMQRALAMGEMARSLMPYRGEARDPQHARDVVYWATVLVALSFDPGSARWQDGLDDRLRYPVEFSTLAALHGMAKQNIGTHKTRRAVLSKTLDDPATQENLFYAAQLAAKAEDFGRRFSRGDPEAAYNLALRYLHRFSAMAKASTLSRSLDKTGEQLQREMGVSHPDTERMGVLPLLPIAALQVNSGMRLDIVDIPIPHLVTLAAAFFILRWLFQWVRMYLSRRGAGNTSTSSEPLIPQSEEGSEKSEVPMDIAAIDLGSAGKNILKVPESLRLDKFEILFNQGIKDLRIFNLHSTSKYRISDFTIPKTPNVLIVDFSKGLRAMQWQPLLLIAALIFASSQWPAVFPYLNNLMSQTGTVPLALGIGAGVLLGYKVIPHILAAIHEAAHAFVGGKGSYFVAGAGDGKAFTAATSPLKRIKILAAGALAELIPGTAAILLLQSEANMMDVSFGTDNVGHFMFWPSILIAMGALVAFVEALWTGIGRNLLVPLVFPNRFSDSENKDGYKIRLEWQSLTGREKREALGTLLGYLMVLGSFTAAVLFVSPLPSVLSITVTFLSVILGILLVPLAITWYAISRSNASQSPTPNRHRNGDGRFLTAA